MFISYDLLALPQVRYVACIAAVILGALFLRLSNPRLDPSEPPLLKPRIPLVGHLLSLMTSRVAYFSRLFEETNPAIATLPILNMKLYVIFSAPLQQSAMRSKNMDAQSFTVNFIPRLFGITQATLDRMLGRDGVHESMSGPMARVFTTTLSGDSLNGLTLSTLNSIADTLNAIGDDGLDIPNIYIWLRQVMGLATAAGLFGHEHNPYGEDPGVIDAQWDFERSMGPLMLGILPSVVARTAYFARKKVSDALEPYYRAKYDQDPGTSNFVRNRSKLIRQYGVPVDELSKNEVSIMLAATSNTIPTLFWYVANIWLRPDLVRGLRAEITSALKIHHPPTDGSAYEITLQLARLESSCPLLASCFRESVRLTSQIITFRHAREDTTISDGEGRSYLLRAGTTVMMPAKVVHRHPLIWGDDAEVFNARRFMSSPGSTTSAADSGDEGKAADRLRKAAFVPFGGGRHLCPGRKFAFGENLAFVAALVMGFEIVGLREDRIRMVDSKMGEAAKPAAGFEGGPVVLSRRKGWENVTWKFAD